MNKALRKELGGYIDQITAIATVIESQVRDLNLIAERLVEIRDEKEEKFENLSDNAKESEKGQERYQVISELTNAIDHIEGVLTALDCDDLTEAVSEIDNARGQEE